MRKRTLLLWLVLPALLLGLFALRPAAQETHIWHIAHADGTGEYSDDPAAPFLTPADGDTFTLLADTLTLPDAYTVRSSVRYTVDLGDGTVIFTRSDIAQTFVSAASDAVCELTVRGDGANLYAPTTGGAMFNFTGENTLRLLGEGQGISVYAPSAVNLAPGGRLYAENAYFMKNSGNMRGLLCSRSGAQMQLRGCTVMTLANRTGLYLEGNGTADLWDTVLVSYDNTTAFTVENDHGAALRLHGTCIVYGAAPATPGILTAEPGSFFGGKWQASLTDGSLIRASASVTFRRREYVSPGAFAEENMTFDLTAYTPSGSSVYTQKQETSLWELTRADGEVLYSDEFYYPLADARDGDSLRLLRDAEVPVAAVLSCRGALTLSLGAFRLHYGGAFAFQTDTPLLLSRDTLALTLASAGGILQGGVGAGPAFRMAGGSFALSGDAFCFVPSLLSLTRGDAALSGVYLDSRGFAADSPLLALGEGGVSASHVTSLGWFADATGEISLSDALLCGGVSGTLLCTSGTVRADSGCALWEGGISAGALLADPGARFTADCSPLCGSVLFRADPAEESLCVYRLTDGTPAPCFITVSRAYVAVAVTDGIRVNLTLSHDRTLHIYVPRASAVRGDMTLRVSAAGLLDEMRVSDGTETELNGAPYLRFSYPYLYPADLDEPIVVRLLVGSADAAVSFTMREYLERALPLAEGPVRTALYAYYRFALLAVRDPDREQILAPYDDIPLPSVARGATSDELASLLRVAIFDFPADTLTFYLSDTVRDVQISLTYGDRVLTRAATDAAPREVLFPAYRLDWSAPVTVTYTGADGLPHTLQTTLPAVTGLSDGASWHYRVTEAYIAYLLTLPARE